MMTPLRLVDELDRLVDVLTLENFELRDAMKENPELRMPVITYANHNYCLLVKLKGYPLNKPSLAVIGELRKKDGSAMGISGSMHCLGYDNGNTLICYGNTWRPDTHLIDLYYKGKLWLDCYDAHLKTGHTIDYYLKHA